MIKYSELKEIFKTFKDKGFHVFNEGHAICWRYGNNPKNYNIFNLSTKGQTVYMNRNILCSNPTYDFTKFNQDSDYYIKYFIDIVDKDMLYKQIDITIKEYEAIMKNYKQKQINKRIQEINKDFKE